MKSIIKIDIYRSLLKKILPIMFVYIVIILVIEAILSESNFRVVNVTALIFVEVFSISLIIGNWKREKNRILELVRNDYFKNKKICCVLFDYEFSPRFTRADLFSGMTFFHELKTISSEFVIKEVGNTVICPIPSFNTFISRNLHGPVELLLISNDGFKKNHVFKIFIVKLVDNFLQKGASVGYYRKNNKKTNKKTDVERELLLKSVTIINNLDTLIDFVEMDDNTDEYNEMITSLRKLIKNGDNTMKYEYMNRILSQISNQLEESDMFYQVLKLVEYFFVYRSLYFEIYKRGGLDLNGSFEMSIGKAKQSQEEKIVFYEHEVVNAYKNVYSALNKNSFNRTKVTYNEICDIFVRLRNDYIGHGTMAFSVSRDLLKSMMIMLKELIIVFSDSRVVLSEKDIISKDLNAIKKSKTGSIMLFWSYREKPDFYVEYYDFNNAIIASNQKDSFELDWSGT